MAPKSPKTERKETEVALQPPKALAPEQQPEKMTAAYKDAGAAVVSAMREALAEKECKPLPQEKLKPFVENPVLDAQGNIIGGKFNSHGDSEINHSLGLRHIIPAEYTFVTVTTAQGEIIYGERRADGSFGKAGNKMQYVPIWSGDSFRASKTPKQAKQLHKSPLAAQAVHPAPQHPHHHAEAPPTLPEIHIGKTVFVGDSLTVAMLHPDLDALCAAHGHEQIKTNARGGIVEIGAAYGGKQTSFMLRRMQDNIAAWQKAGVKRVVIFGGVNDIASQKTPKHIQENIEAMYQLAHDHEMSVVGVTIPMWDTEKAVARIKKRQPNYPLTAAELTNRTNEVNTWIRSKNGAEKTGADSIVDVSAETDQEVYKRQPDGLHFQPSASKKMAAFITAQANIRM